MIRGVWLTLALAIAGCTNQPIRPDVAPLEDPVAPLWAARRAALEPLKTWVLDGRIAVQQGKEGGQARIHWAQTGDAFELRLMAPLSQGTYRLHGDPSGVALETPQNQAYEAADLATLMTTHLRWNLPVDGARYWVLGLPAPGSTPTNLLLDNAGRLTDMAQDGWRISVLDYQSAEPMALPRKLFLTANNLQLRLAITQWPTSPH